MERASSTLPVAESPRRRQKVWSDYGRVTYHLQQKSEGPIGSWSTLENRCLYPVTFTASLRPRWPPVDSRGGGGQEGSKRGRGRRVDSRAVEYRITNHKEEDVWCFSPLIILVVLSRDQDAKKQYCLGRFWLRERIGQTPQSVGRVKLLDASPAVICILNPSGPCIYICDMVICNTLKLILNKS